MRDRFSSRRLLNLILRNLSVILLVAIALIGVLFANNFLSKLNIMNLLRQICINACLSIGFTYVVLVDGFDLSQGNIMTVAAVLLVSVMNKTGSVFLGIVVSMLSGCLFGAFTGMIIKLIKGDYSDSYLITLGTSMIAQGFVYVYTGGNQQVLADKMKGFRNIARVNWGNIPAMAVCCLALMVVAHLILRKTSFGRSLYLVGSNKKAAYMTGIKTHNMKMYAFIISGFCAALGAIVMTARTGSIAVTAGSGYEFDAACATLIGGNKAGSASSGIHRTLIGVLLLGLIGNVMNLMNYGTVEQLIVKGLVMLLAIFSNRFTANSMEVAKK